MFFFFLFFSPVPTRLQDSDGEKSDQDLVVDIANETVSSKELVKQSKKKKFSQWILIMHTMHPTQACSCDGGLT